ncbi:hypothetical protein FHG89_19850 [Micromonospora orduensis]|uniref:Uncharacterized protein n=1 Tax=Micromonospora orduensis TaxID=1420891 RepID=A0A5C4QJB9_9ACTN|nr:hypothetical protein [Micromonospora orduensis]TNH26841.1 hypothetical protein FHG89_19850 [Micromonospora orduensis]
MSAGQPGPVRHPVIHCRTHPKQIRQENLVPDSVPQAGNHPRWLLPASASGMLVAVAGFAWLLSNAGLDRADKISSITAVALGLLLAVISCLGWLHRHRAAPAATLAAAADNRWGSGDVVTRTGRLEDLPDWPVSYPGYRYDSEGSASVRIFGGKGPVVVDGFPAKMNGCAHQQFFVRWRALGEEQIRVQVVASPDLIPIAEAAEGSAGWMASHGCGQPSWTVAAESQIVDVHVRWQRWVPDT